MRGFVLSGVSSLLKETHRARGHLASAVFLSGVNRSNGEGRVHSFVGHGSHASRHHTDYEEVGI